MWYLAQLLMRAQAIAQTEVSLYSVLPTIAIRGRKSYLSSESIWHWQPYQVQSVISHVIITNALDSDITLISNGINNGLAGHVISYFSI